MTEGKICPYTAFAFCCSPSYSREDYNSGTTPLNEIWQVREPFQEAEKFLTMYPTPSQRICSFPLHMRWRKAKVNEDKFNICKTLFRILWGRSGKCSRWPLDRKGCVLCGPWERKNIWLQWGNRAAAAGRTNSFVRSSPCSHLHFGV